MEWYKRYTNRSNHGQMYEAGFWGVVVFDALCDSSAAFNLEGKLPKVYATPEYLARQLRLTDAEMCQCHETSRSVTTAKNSNVTHENHVVTVLMEALNRLFLTGLLVKNGDFVVIDGWERKQRKVPKSDAERSRNYREKKKTQQMVEDKNQTNTTVTKRHVDESDANVRVTHREEKRRLEKIREEKKRKEKKTTLLPSELATVPDGLENNKTTETNATSVFVSLKTALEASYKQKRGEPYLFAHGKDGSALKRLIGLYTPNVILERWEVGLDAVGYRQVNNVAQLAQKWNDLAAPSTPAKPTSVYAGRNIPNEFWQTVEDVP